MTIHSKSEPSKYAVLLAQPSPSCDNGLVVKVVRPTDSELSDDPVKILGNRVNLGIIAELRRTPDQTSSQLARALDIPKPTIQKSIERLLDLNMLIADPPRHTATRGQWVRYRTNNPLVTETWLQLGQAMQEL